MTKIPRVLLGAISLEPGNGGIARVARLTARVLGRLAASGRIHASAVSLLDKEPPRDLGIAVTAVAGSRLRFVAEIHRAAATHTHVVYDSLAAARAHCRIPPFRRPFLSWIHGVEVWSDDVPTKLKRVRRKWALRADALVANSAFTRDHSGLTHAAVCWLATEFDNPGAQGIESETLRVLMLSRVDDEYKGHRAMVACWPEVIAAIPNATLTIAGRGPRLEELRREVAASPGASTIELVGFVPEEEIDSLWSRSTVFALPSRGEGFGLVYVEAMRHGVPIIATVHDAGGEVNVDGVTGFNVNLDVPDELPHRLIELLRNRVLAREMGLRGRERWRRCFTLRRFDERLTAILEDFMAPRNTSPG